MRIINVFTAVLGLCAVASIALLFCFGDLPEYNNNSKQMYADGLMSYTDFIEANK